MLRVDDDISQLQALPQHILAQEKAITALTGQKRRSKMVCSLRRLPTANIAATGEIYRLTLSMRKRGAYQQLPHYSAELHGAAGGRLRPAENGCPDGNKSTAKCRADGGETRSQRHAGEGR